MSRLLHLPLLAIPLLALAAYLFIRPPALQQGTPTSLSARDSTSPAQPPRAPAPHGGDNASSLLADLERAGLDAGGVPPVPTTRLRPSQSGNPPRTAARHTGTRPPLLHLPAVLPARVLNIPILMYHHVAPVAAVEDPYLGLTVTDSDFAAQLAYLAGHGYHTMLLRQVFAALYQGAPLPAHPVVLTFDDGYLDNYTDALPLLRRYHQWGEFNIITAYVGQTVGINHYMTWPQIKALVAAGMEIGSHTVDHQDLGQLPVNHVRFELRDSRNVLQLTLGVPVQFLAYPSGEPFKSGSAEARHLLLTLLPQYGYVGAVLDGPLTTSRQDARAPYQLQRIRVSGGEGLADFAAGLGQ